MNHDLGRTTTRRTFIKQTAAVLTMPFAAPLILAKPVAGANAKLNLAWVGFGNQGGRDLLSCANGNNVVALCDCGPKYWPQMQQKFPEAKFYKDFRIMLREMGDKIDAVGVGTPDHTHFAIAYMAMSMGKHVFVEKPLVHSLWQARTLQKLAVEKNLVTQMGNQGHASEGAHLDLAVPLPKINRRAQCHDQPIVWRRRLSRPRPVIVTFHPHLAYPPVPQFQSRHFHEYQHEEPSHHHPLHNSHCRATRRSQSVHRRSGRPDDPARLHQGRSHPQRREPRLEPRCHWRARLDFLR